MNLNFLMLRLVEQALDDIDGAHNKFQLLLKNDFYRKPLYYDRIPNPKNNLRIRPTFTLVTMDCFSICVSVCLSISELNSNRCTDFDAVFAKL